MQILSPRLRKAVWPLSWRLGLLAWFYLLAIGPMAIAQDAPEQETTEEAAADGGDAKEDDEDEEERRKPPLEIGQLRPQFGEVVVDPGVQEGPTLALKPGHWTATVQTMQANYNDFVGRFSAEILDENQRPVALEHSRFGLRVTRGVTLVNGKERDIQGELFLPQRTEGTRLLAELVDSDTGAGVFLFQPKIERVPAYQYNIVVLAKEPAKYAFLKVTNTVRAPWEEEFAEGSQAYYQVSLLKAGATIPLPENPLTWTSVAFIVWDEVDPTRLSVAQQDALLDWLHWGGRLIVNGPDSLASLHGSFLDEYLPADDGGPRQIKTVDLEPLSTHWGARESGGAIAALSPRQSFSGIVLEKRDGSRSLAGTDNLFVTHDVGRGVIMVSAFQLAERDFINWSGFDSFLNGALFGRPRRIFSSGPYGALQADWVDHHNRRLDAHFTTPLRLFARDAQSAANTSPPKEVEVNQFGGSVEIPQMVVDRPGGVGSWDEFSPTADVARELLLVAAGVQVPGAGFIIACLALYLVVLVPVNWLIFHTIQRVEWAWIAVPIVAMLGTWAVVKQAQLDIGFVRAQTEVGVLELFGSHDRGVLSRFTAMYSSLATTYEIEFPDQEAALVLPFPANKKDPTAWEASVVFDESSSPRLEGLTVASSATRLVHAEQIQALDGPLRLGKSSRGLAQVENRSQFNIRDAVVIRRSFDRNGKPRYEGCWLGEIKAGRSAVLGMRTLIWDPKGLPFANERVTAAAGRLIPSMNVDALVKLACQFEDKHDRPATQRMETRLVGVIDEGLPGMEVAPEASQRKGATVVIAHLEYGPLAASRPDVNSPADVVTQTENDESQ